MRKYAVVLAVMMVFCVCVSVNAADKWVSKGVGTDDGKAEIKGNNITITAAGEGDIRGGEDEFHFVYQKAKGDVAITALLESLEDIDMLTRAGVMIRENLEPGSKFVYVFLLPSGRPICLFRAETDDECEVAKGDAAELPAHLKLVRKGSSFVPSTSEDGKSWDEMPDAEIDVDMEKEVFVGVAASSNVEGEFTEAVFSNVEVK